MLLSSRRFHKKHRRGQRGGRIDNKPITIDHEVTRDLPEEPDEPIDTTFADAIKDDLKTAQDQQITDQKALVADRDRKPSLGMSTVGEQIVKPIVAGVKGVLKASDYIGSSGWIKAADALFPDGKGKDTTLGIAQAATDITGTVVAPEFQTVKSTAGNVASGDLGKGDALDIILASTPELGSIKNVQRVINAIKKAKTVYDTAELGSVIAHKFVSESLVPQGLKDLFELEDTVPLTQAEKDEEKRVSELTDEEKKGEKEELNSIMKNLKDLNKNPDRKYTPERLNDILEFLDNISYELSEPRPKIPHFLLTQLNAQIQYNKDQDKVDALAEQHTQDNLDNLDKSQAELAKIHLQQAIEDDKKDERLRREAAKEAKARADRFREIDRKAELALKKQPTHVVPKPTTTHAEYVPQIIAPHDLPLIDYSKQNDLANFYKNLGKKKDPVVKPVTKPIAIPKKPILRPVVPKEVKMFTSAPIIFPVKQTSIFSSAPTVETDNSLVRPGEGPVIEGSPFVMNFGDFVSPLPIDMCKHLAGKKRLACLKQKIKI